MDESRVEKLAACVRELRDVVEAYTAKFYPEWDGACEPGSMVFLARKADMLATSLPPPTTGETK